MEADVDVAPSFYILFCLESICTVFSDTASTIQAVLRFIYDTNTVENPCQLYYFIIYNLLYIATSNCFVPITSILYII